MVYIPNYFVSKEEEKNRLDYHATSVKELKASIESRQYVSQLEGFDVMIQLPDEIPMASNPKWASRRFGAVNTVEQAGSLAMIAKIICNHFGICIPMRAIFSLIEDNGYRLWKLKEKERILNYPFPNIINIKKDFTDDNLVQQCQTLKEIYHVCGKPVGVTTSMFFIDNFIEALGLNKKNTTRIKSVDKIFWNLEHNIPVPVRVEPSIYRKNFSKHKEDHYVVLYGISKGKAIVVDPSWNFKAGVCELPVNDLFNAMVGNEKLVCAWDLKSLV